MNVTLMGLLALVLLYLQYNFLSFFHIILIGLLVGVIAGIESSPTMMMVYLVVIGIIILMSYVFKVIDVLNAVNQFNHTIHLDNSTGGSFNTYMNRDPMPAIPKELRKLDLSKDLQKEACQKSSEEEGFYAPTKFVDGEEAKSELNTCASVCAKHTECVLVTMPNDGGKNNECQFYGISDKNAKVIDDTKKELDTLNATTDMMKATHYALVRH